MTPEAERSPSVTIREAARMLSCAAITVRRLVRCGKLDACYVGRVIRIRRASVAEYYRANPVGRRST